MIEIKFGRRWSMPSPQTFSMPPIRDLLKRWIEPGQVVIDPFARDATIATITNDLNPNTAAEYHLPAEEFCEVILQKGVRADVVLFDPPYSPRQMSECYNEVGYRPAGRSVTQNAVLYKHVRDGLDRLLREGGIAISFGWNTSGFGKGRGYVPEEILMVAHGGAHNDTHCVVERKAWT